MSYPSTPAEAYRAPMLGIGDIAAWAAGLVCLLMFSQGWAAPLTGYAEGTENSALLRDAYLPVYVIVLAMVGAQAQRMPWALVREPFLIALLVLAFASTAWSIDPGATLRRALALGFTSVAALAMASRWSWKALAELVAAAFAIQAVASLLVAVAIPEWGRMSDLFPGAWRGLWLEKNALGGLMVAGALAQVAAAIYAPKRALLWLGMAAISLLLVFMSTSKTSLVSLLFGLGVMGACWMARLGPAAAIAALWLAAAGGLGAVGVMTLAPDLLFDALGKDATLTGRTQLWAAALTQLEHHKLLGFGYGVLWDQKGIWTPAAWIAHDAKFTAGHAHNGWLEVALGTGVVGLGVFVLYYLQTLWRSLREFMGGPGAYLALPIVAVFTLHSFTEVSILKYNSVEWMLFVLAAARMGADRRQTL